MKHDFDGEITDFVKSMEFEERYVMTDLVKAYAVL